MNPKPALLIAQKLHALPTKLRDEIHALDRVMRCIDESQKVKPACLLLAGTPEALGLSYDRLRALFYKWKRSGRALHTLINHNKCGGCGLPGCTRPRRKKIPQDLLDEWIKRAQGNTKRGFANAWRELIMDLAAGKRLPGVGTWIELWNDLHPSREIPDKCPWSVGHPPKGWSERSFMKRMPYIAETKLAKEGFAAMAPLLPQVRRDYSKLLPLQEIMFDDKDVDFTVWAKVNGRRVAVTLKCLFAIDAATRKILAWGVRPAIPREDGKTDGITRADMHHLVATILAQYGIPDYGMLFVVENGTATLNAVFADKLERLSGGLIQVRWTGMITGDLAGRGYDESIGNPRGKAILESTFNVLDIILGTVKGQRGSNYLKKPGEYDGRVQVAERMAKIIDALPERDRQKLAADLPFHDAGDAYWIIDRAVKLLNARDQHEMQGFESRDLWRYGDGGQFLPLLPADARTEEERAEIEHFLALPKATRDGILAKPGNHLIVRESPEQRWQRLTEGVKTTAISPEIMLDLMLDEEVVTYRGGDVLDVPMKRGPERGKLMRYRGGEHQLSPGDKVVVAFNSNNPHTGAWLRDDKGRYLGRMHSDGEGVDDTTKQRLDLGAYQKAQKDLVNRVQRRLRNRQDLEAEKSRYVESLQILSTMEAGLLLGDNVIDDETSGEISRALVTTETRTREKKAKKGAVKFISTK